MLRMQQQLFVFNNRQLLKNQHLINQSECLWKRVKNEDEKKRKKEIMKALFKLKVQARD